jgi:hypothetical protein
MVMRREHGILLLLLLLLIGWAAVPAWAAPPSNTSPIEDVLFLQPKTTPAPGEACSAGGSSAASNCPSWGGFVRTMPGTVCTMNVGNNNVFAGYTNKIRNCDEAQGRSQGIAGTACDVLNIIELNSDAQCGCACDPKNTCTTYTSPEGVSVCIDDPERPEECKEGSFGYYEPERCELCKGCGAGRKPTCESQAQVLCDPEYYEPPYCHQVADKGCDCMCIRKGPCVPPPSRCIEQVIEGPPDCDTGNYALCRKCDFDSDGSWDWGSCVAHPTHCVNFLNMAEPILMEQCLERCSTPIMNGAAAFLSTAKVRTISGDLNCDPDGCSWFGTCPWVERMRDAWGLEICNHNQGTTILGCEVDLVLSNSCGCAGQENRDPSPGDHSTIVFNAGSRIWSGPLTEILSANSAASCPDPDQSNSTSDSLGMSASCPTSENGQPVGSCSSWGHTTNAKVRYYTLADECDRPEVGIPQVLVCDIATAQASASCTPGASSGSSSFVTVGKANSSQAATCSNGTPYNPAARTVMASEIIMPSLVRRSDGNLYYRVERDAHRDRGAECSAPISQPCDVPVDIPVSSRKMLEAEACVDTAHTPENTEIDP